MCPCNSIGETKNERISKEPGRVQLARHLVAFFAALSVLAIGLFYASRPGIHVKAADHRDSPTADANPEGDITDLFAFVDPNDTTKLVLIMNVWKSIRKLSFQCGIFLRDPWVQFEIVAKC